MSALSLVTTLALIGIVPAAADEGDGTTDPSTTGPDTTQPPADQSGDQNAAPADETGDQNAAPADESGGEGAPFEVQPVEPPSDVAVPAPATVPGASERSELEGDPRTITVRSETAPDDPGPQFTFDFRLEACQEVGASGDACTPFDPPQYVGPAPVTLGDGGAHTWGDLEYGRTYRLRQDASDPAWALTNVECAPADPVQSSGNVEAREATVRLADANDQRHTTCVFVNTDAAIEVHKKADRAANGTVGNLGGALFQVYSNSSYTTPVPGASCTTSASGVCTIAGLSTSTTYYLREVTAPTDYQRIDTMTESSGGSKIYGEQFFFFSNSTTGSRDFANRRVDPPFPDACGLNIALVMDLSNSIDATELAQMKTSAEAFVTALEGTPSSVAGFTFATSAPASGNANLALTSVATAGGANTARTWIDNRTEPGGQAGGTNWDAGLRQLIAGAGTYDIVVFLTDGNPTFYGSPQSGGSGSSTTFREVEEGVFSANGVKATNPDLKMVGVAIGSGASVDNIAAVSGPIVNDDYFLAANFQDLENKLEEIATNLCGGTVTVRKLVEGPNGFEEAAGWDFTVSDSAQGSGTTDSNGVTPAFDVNPPLPRTVTITEDLASKPGYSIVQTGGKNATCVRNGNAVPGADITNTADGVSLEIGTLDIVTCEFKNTPDPVTINVRKETVNGVGGPFTIERTGNDSGTGSFDFTTSAGNNPTPVQSWTNLFPGTYTLTETSLPSGDWEFTGIDCGQADVPNQLTQVALAAGETVNCTFTNERAAQPGSIRVVKTSVGSTGTFDFTLTGQPGRQVTTNFPDVAVLADPWENLAPGQSYTLDEVDQDAWAEGEFSCFAAGQPQIDGDQPVLPIEDGENWTCHITDYKRPSVTIVKDANPADDTPFDFNIEGGAAPGALDTNFALSDPTSPSQSFNTELVSDRYTVTELAPFPNGWDLTGIDCGDFDRAAVDLGAGQVELVLDWGDAVTCTFTNDGSGSVHVTKATVPPGLDGTFPVSLDQDGGGYSAGWDLAGDTDDHTFNDVPAGVNLTLGEAAVANWALESIVCDGQNVTNGDPFQVAPGQTAECVVTNSADQGTIVVHKETVTPNDQDATEFFFSDLDGVLDIDLLMGGQSDSITVDPGTYRILEPRHPGWLLFDIQCDAGGSGDVANRIATYNVGPGETVECTFYNGQAELGVSKSVVTATPDATVFPFTGAINASLPGGDSDSVYVGAGDQDSEFQVTEGAVTGWDLTDITCDPGGSGAIGSRTATYTVQAGDSVGCDFENTERGSITIAKATDPPLGDNSPYFDFGGDLAGFLLKDGQSQTFQNRAPGDYTQSEGPQAGWQLTDISCDGDYTPDLAQGAVTVHLGAGEHITCTFTNEGSGSVHVTKATDPPGLSDNFPVTLAQDGGGYSAGWTLTGDTDDHTFNDVPAGVDLSLGEDSVPNWALESIVCDDVDVTNGDPFQVTPGETVECVVTNTPSAGNVRVEKDTDPDGLSGTFPVNLTDGGSYDENGNLVDDGGTFTFTDVPLQSDLSLTEDLTALPWSLDGVVCDGVDIAQGTFQVQPGETVDCVVTNLPDPGRVIITKDTDPEGLSGPFTANLSGPNGYDQNRPLAGDGSTVQIFDVPADTGYAVTETDAAGFNLVDVQCQDGPDSVDASSFTVPAGGIIGCVITNSEPDPGEVIVTKDTNPEGLSGDFLITVDGPGGAQQHTLTTDGDSHGFDVPAGTGFSVDETLPAGWNAYDIECDDGQTDPADFDVQAGQTVECVVTNGEPDPGRVLITKHTDPEGLSGPFTANLSGPNTYDEDRVLAGDGSTVQIFDVPADTGYAVTEPDTDGFGSVDIACQDGPDSVDASSFTVPAGGIIGCVITNSEPDPGEVIVTKVTDPAGLSGPFTVNLAGGPDSLDDSQVLPGDGDGHTYENVPAGTGYVVTETDSDGFSSVTIGCEDEGQQQLDPADLTVEAGETVTCTVTNSEAEPGFVHVTKATVPPGLNGDFLVTLDGPGGMQSHTLTGDGDDHTFDAAAGTGYSIDETLPSGWNAYDIVCDDGQADPADFDVQAGETVECVVTNDANPGSVRVEKDTDPDGLSGTFPVNLTDNDGYDENGSLVDDGGTFTFADVPLQTPLSLSEDLTGLPWSLDGVVCDGVDITQGTFQVQPGETLDCVVTNLPDPGRVLITKHTDPESLSGPFTANLSGPNAYDEDRVLTGDGSTVQILDVPADTGYAVTEPDTDGFGSVDIACQDGPDSVDASSFTVEAGGIISCVITNSEPDPGEVIVTKVTDPAGLSGPFTVNLAGGPDSLDDSQVLPGDGDSHTYENVPAGTGYTVTETDSDGFGTVMYSCADSDGPVPNENFTVEAGDTVTCTVTNSQASPGQVIVTKDTNPEGLSGEFLVTVDGPGGPQSDTLTGDGDSHSFDVAAGTGYSVDETLPAGWNAYDIVCDDGQTDPVDFDVQAGQTVECAVTNSEPDPGIVTVIKDTNPEGLSGPFTANLAGGPNGLDQDRVLPADGAVDSWQDVPAGTGYAVTEPDTAGFNLVGYSCVDGNTGQVLDESDFTVEAGGLVQCNITNANPDPGEVIVTKVTDPAGLEGTFPINLTGPDSYDEDGSLVGDGGQHTFSDVPANTGYVLTEDLTGLPWSLSSIVCDGQDVTNGEAFTVEAGESVECTVTNDADDGTIVVHKETITPNPDDETAFTFTGAIDAELKDGESASVQVAPGEYGVSEVVPDDWAFIGAECTEGGSYFDGTLTIYDVGPGETVECTYTNGQAEIEVTKQTDPDGSDQSFDFNDDIDADLTDGQSASEYVAADGSPTAFSVTEAVQPGWQVTDITCDEGGSGDVGTRTATYDVGPGDSVNCTFENTELGSIEVVKVADPADDTNFDFEGTLGDFSLTDPSSPDTTFNDLLPGEYDITELVTDGWALTGLQCVGADSTPLGETGVTVDLAASEDVTCTFENTELGSITVVKDTGGIEPAQEFPFSFDGDPFGLVDQQSQTFDGLLPDEYEVLEPADLMPQYWQLAGTECVSDLEVANGDEVVIDAAALAAAVGPADVTEVDDGVLVALAAGENVTCTFANVQVFPAPGITITKTPSIESGSPGDVVTYTYVVENTGQARLDNVKVVDDKLGEITLDKTTLEPGEKATGTKDYTLQGSDVGNLENVAVVTADPEGGQDSISSQDDAVVEVAVVSPQAPVENPPSETPTEVEGSQLPFTGAVIGGLVSLALILLAAGFMLVTGARRRRREAGA